MHVYTIPPFTTSPVISYHTLLIHGPLHIHLTVTSKPHLDTTDSSLHHSDLVYTSLLDPASFTYQLLINRNLESPSFPSTFHSFINNQHYLHQQNPKTCLESIITRRTLPLQYFASSGSSNRKQRRRCNLYPAKDQSHLLEARSPL